jgi:hypothetical protein
MTWLWLFMGCAGGLEVDDWVPSDAGLERDEVVEPALEADGLEGPSGLALWRGEIFVAEEDGGRVQSVDTREIWVEGLGGPTWLETTEWGLVIADGALGELWLLEETGDLVLLSSGHTALGRIRADGANLWWLDPDVGELWLVPLPNGEAALMADDLQTPVGLSLVEGRPWILEQDSKELTEFDPDTGSVTTLLDLDDPPHDLVTEDGQAFITTRSTRWPYGGFILAMDGDGVEEISYSPPEPERIEVGESHVYWTSKQSITRVNREGGTYELVAGMTAVEDFILVDDGVVWTDGQAGEVRSW